MARITRRGFLGGLGATAAAGAIGCRPGAALQPGSIDHIVMVMMENRTFDHYLGSLSLEEGRGDVDGLVAYMSNPDPTGSGVLPVFRSTEWCLPDPPHGWSSSRAQFADGAMDGFTREYWQRHGNNADPQWVMGYHGRADLPVTYALADAYTVCDRWFASLMGPTWPNRMYAVAGTSDGERGNDLGQVLEGFQFKTIFDSLIEADVSWSAYTQSASTLWLFPSLRARKELLSFDHFVAHARGGTLPAVSWVEPAFGINDDHPPAHPLLGQLFLSTVYEALASSPQWDRTLLIVYYDEHGGFYDHVPPPKAPDERADEGFDQLGFRVPSMAIGPYVRPGACNNTQLEHTSVIAHLEREYDLEPLTMRTEAANDLWSLIDMERLEAGQPYAPVTMPVIELSEDEIEDQCRQMRSRTLEQPFLEALLDRHPAPPHLDRRGDMEACLREFLDTAARLGTLKVT